MSSVGQGVGMLAGAAIGFFTGGIGYVALGASLGGMVGSAIDPPKGPDIVGPRLEDLSVQTSTYGAPLARAYGTVAVTGNVFWLEGDQLKETTSTEEQGGKGGGGQSTTTYHYSATFAVGLMHVPAGATVSLRRLWLDTDLVYEAGSDNVESIIASNSGGGFLAGSRIWQEVGTWWLNALASGQNWTFYDGSDDQLPNARMQADKGAANVSAYPGMSYIVFEDLSLEKYSNTLMRAQVKAELSICQATNDLDYLGNLDGTWGFTNGRELKSVVSYDAGHFAYAVVLLDPWSGNPYGVDFYRHELAVSNQPVGGYSLSGMGYADAPHIFNVCSSDRPVVITLQAYGIPTTTETLLRIHSKSGTISTAGTIQVSNFAYAMYSACIDGADLVLFLKDYPLAKFNGAEFSFRTASTYQINKGGLSENYFFGVLDTGYAQPTSTTVYKFDRDTLTLVDTFTQSVPGTWAAIHVVSNDEFYTMSSGNVYRWLDGVVVESLVGMGSFNADDQSSNTWFAVNGSTVFNIVGRDSNKTPEMYLGHPIVNAETASLRVIVTDECTLAGVAAGDLDLDELTDHAVRGYKIAARSSVRAALEPLQAAFPFDVSASGYKLRFVSRGGASVATIPSEDLGATDGDDLPVLLPVSREMESQLPYRVNVRYSDAGREYDVGEQYAERPAESLRERTVELAIVLTTDEAAQKADVLLEKEWIERTDIGPFTLPPTWSELEAADVVTIEHRGKQHEARMTRVEYLPDGRLQCQAKLTQAASYVSTAQGSDPLVLGQSLVPLKGSTNGLLLDIPMILPQQDKPGIVAAAYGLASGWPGATIVRSDDSGATYQAVFSTNDTAVVFRATSVFGAGRTDIIDAANVLTVSEVSRNPSLSSVSFASAAAGQNLAAIGADGRWEIVSFLTVTDNGDDTWTLRDFMRGRFGTEWAAPLHESGDMLIMLTTANVGFIGLPLTAINAPRLYRSLTQGARLDSAADVSYTYSAVNLKPLSPIRLNGHRDPITLDWTLTATRRSRTPVEPFSGLQTPVGEASEAYDVEIWDADYLTLKRTFSGLTSLSAPYTAAQQIEDFGGAQSTLYVKWHPLSATAGRGYPMQSSILRNMLDDPFVDFVVFGLHCNGSDDGTTFTDVRGKSVSVFGNARTRTGTKKYGTASGYCDGTGDYIKVASSVDFNIFGGDHAIEGWFYFDSVANTPHLIVVGTGTTNRNTLWVSGAKLRLTAVVSNTYYDHIIGTTTLTTGAFYHFAISRSGSTTRLFINGTLEGSTTSTAWFNGSSQELTIGFQPYGEASGDYFNGYFDDIRATKGSARGYTSNFTPPPAEFPDPT